MWVVIDNSELLLGAYRVLMTKQMKQASKDAGLDLLELSHYVAQVGVDYPCPSYLSRGA